jgi:anhydro-N-acetylmuramic acid kinase
LSEGEDRDPKGGGPVLGRPPVWALGLMSGTSMDGVDAALVRTDGVEIAALGPALTQAYDPEVRARLRAAVAGDADEAEIGAVERLITDHHGTVAVRLVELWRTEAGSAAAPAVIGFHGHTLWHRPREGKTRQIGDGRGLARRMAVPVVDDFRSADMAAGGEGAPLAPLYHAAKLRGADVSYPLCIVNLGGVANVTWIASANLNLQRDTAGILAFDTGPASAFLDDWAQVHTGRPFDEGGALAARGRVDAGALARLLADPYFTAPPPKSLDRAGFDVSAVAGLGAADGAATLTEFSAQAVARAREFLPQAPKAWFATGGGRHNGVLMNAIGSALGAVIRPVEDLGWNGDVLEAEAFAFLAVRSLRGLPLSLPATTGAKSPVAGGRLNRPAQA